MSVLISDHNVARTLRICDRALILDDGHLIAEGNARDIAGGA
jgi:lipopolysaccharide export system ATP-binding protein